MYYPEHEAYRPRSRCFALVKFKKRKERRVFFYHASATMRPKTMAFTFRMFGIAILSFSLYQILLLFFLTEQTQQHLPFSFLMLVFYFLYSAYCVCIYPTVDIAYSPWSVLIFYSACPLGSHFLASIRRNSDGWTDGR